MIKWHLNIFFKIVLILNILILQGCLKDKIKVVTKSRVTNFIISSVSVSNNQLVINGSNLQDAKNIKLIGTSFEENFTPESVSATSIIANGTRVITIGVGQVFNLIISNASGSATFQVDFSLTNHSVALSKLVVTGATSGQVLKFNGTDWAPSNLLEAQFYLGTWNASNNIGGVPDLSTVSSTAGEYYIASIAGTLGAVNYAVGDWIISDGYQWQKIAASKTSVSSFQGRKGIVVLTPADYVSLKNTGTGKVTGSSINDLADIDLSIAPTNGQALVYSTAGGLNKWIAGAAGGSGIALTDLSATAPLTYNSGTGVFAISAATTSDPGSLSSADKTKLDGLTAIPSSGDGMIERFSGILAMKTCSAGEFLIWYAVSGWTCTTSVTLPGTSAQTLGMIRNTTADTTGNNLTIQASGSTLAATDKSGGSLVLSGGTSTGTGSSEIDFKTSTAAATGIADNAPTTKMTILGNGNVGIGTTTPGSKLSVTGNGYFDGNITATGTVTVARGDATHASIMPAGNYSGFWWGNSGTVLNLGRIDQGNTNYSFSEFGMYLGASTGIGWSTNPVGVSPDITIARISSRVLGLGTDNGSIGGVFEFGPTSALGTPTSGSGRIGFVTDHFALSGGITTDGNVGIGTTAPGGALDVRGKTTLSGAFAIGVTSLTVASTTGFPTTGTIVIDNETITYSAITATTFTCTATTVAHASGATVKNSVGMLVTNTGNVGIGTSNPTQKLSLTGQLQFVGDNPDYRFRFGAEDGSDLKFYFDTAFNGGNDQFLTINPSLIYLRDGGAEFLTASGRFRTGNVAFFEPASGVASFQDYSSNGVPIELKSVASLGSPSASSGRIGFITDHFSLSNDLSVTGNILASGTITASSDRRLKKNIRPIEDALEKLDAITGVKYFWIEPKLHNDGEQIGVIAQDVEKVFPQAVVTSSSGLKSVSYMGLVAPVIQAIKELHHKFMELIARVTGLEEKANMYEARNEILEKENLEIKARLLKLEQILSKQK